ncbi:MAG: hypothetical protein CL609_02200 [Anaerolineaceae bacterium]|nr:hypothetical protein [Anaerolineaceae bacterium]
MIKNNFFAQNLVKFFDRSLTVQNRGLTIIRIISIFFIIVTVVLFFIQLVTYSRIRASLPPGSRIAGVPVGNLDRQEAADRLVKAYSIPVEIHYGDAVIQIKPSVIGFELDLQTMLTAADQQRINQSFWVGFWEFLWNRIPQPDEVPLRAEISEERLRLFLEQEIAVRYDRPSTAAIPVPGSTSFAAGESGTKLDIDRAVILIKDALQSPTDRFVNLTFENVDPIRPSMQNLQILLQQVIDVSGFDGLTEIYLLDLQNRQEVSFAYQNGQTVQPGIAFTAASTMKIPIMVSVFKRTDEPAPVEVSNQISLMIERSENDPADRLMENVLEGNLGPLTVTDDLKEMGLENTFLAGYFYPGAPLLRRFETPANLRTDVSTDPDFYNQTTAVDMGILLDDIYQCASKDGGTLRAIYPDEVTQTECQTMLDYLAKNRIGVLIQAGLPEGTQIAHKHGWITEVDGVIHTISDAGIVYSPGGNYVLVVFLYHPVQLVFDTANLLTAQLSSAVYNFYNLTIN